MAGDLCVRFHQAVELIGRRWSGAVIQLLMQHRLRYAEFRAAIPDISDRMLSERLRELEAAGIVVRTVLPDPPVRVEYDLTEKGRALKPALTRSANGPSAGSRQARSGRRRFRQAGDARRRNDTPRAAATRRPHAPWRRPDGVARAARGDAHLRVIGTRAARRDERPAPQATRRLVAAIAPTRESLYNNPA